MSTGRGTYLILGIILLLGVGEKQQAGTNLDSETAGEGAGPRSGGGSSGESPRIPPSLAGSTRLFSELQLHNKAQLCSH